GRGAACACRLRRSWTYRGECLWELCRHRRKRDQTSPRSEASYASSPSKKQCEFRCRHYTFFADQVSNKKGGTRRQPPFVTHRNLIRIELAARHVEREVGVSSRRVIQVAGMNGLHSHYRRQRRGCSGIGPFARELSQNRV